MVRYTHPLKAQYRALRDLLLNEGTEAAVAELFDVDAKQLTGTDVARRARELRTEISWRRKLAQEALCPVSDEDTQVAAEWLLAERARTYCVQHWTGAARSYLNKRLLNLTDVIPERSDKLSVDVDRGIVDSRWYEGDMTGLMDDLIRHPRAQKWLVLVHPGDVDAFTNAVADTRIRSFYIHREYTDRTVFVLSFCLG